MTEKKPETITTRIWREEAEPDNPFAAAKCYCAGYDVFGDLLGKISWPEYMFLLFQLEAPSKTQARLLEAVAIVLANAGPRDLSIRAAMNNGVVKATRASALMSALAVGAGNLGGGREVYVCLQGWRECETDLEAWADFLTRESYDDRADVWLPFEHAPGFDPHADKCSTPVKQALSYFAGISPGSCLPWLQAHREKLESRAGHPMAMAGVVSAALADLGFTPEQAEALYLLLRLPGAAVHALEQEKAGWRKYPFFTDGLEVIGGPLKEEIS